MNTKGYEQKNWKEKLMKIAKKNYTERKRNNE